MTRFYRLKQVLSRWLLLVSLLLSGCFPAVYEYWEPSAAGGQLIKGAGPGTIASYDTIEFSYDEVRIQVSSGGDGAGFSLLVPQGREISFVSDEIMLREKGGGLKIIKFVVTSLNTNSLTRIFFSPTDPLVAKRYDAGISFGRPETLHFELKLPPVRVNGQLYEIPEIKFTRKKGFGVFGP